MACRVESVKLLEILILLDKLAVLSIHQINDVTPLEPVVDKDGFTWWDRNNPVYMVYFDV